MIAALKMNFSSLLLVRRVKSRNVFLNQITELADSDAGSVQDYDGKFSGSERAKTVRRGEGVDGGEFINFFLSFFINHH
jgi:hypothetical protein